MKLDSTPLKVVRNMDRQTPTKLNSGGNRKLEESEIPEIKRQILAGESLTALGRMYGVGYQAMYRLARGETWGHVEPSGNLIQRSRPERRLSAEDRDRAYKTKKRKNCSNAKLARAMNVSESTIARAVRDAELVLAFRVQRLLLTSGDHSVAMSTYRITRPEAERLTGIAAGSRMPKHLKGELEC